MSTLQLGSAAIPIKDYECSCDGVYLPKEQLRLWLYVNMTDACNAACPFCVNAGAGSGHLLSPELFGKTLEKVKTYISGISLTGGEPVLNPALLEETVRVIEGIISPNIELDLVTNGTNLNKLPYLRGLERFATIHLSRHTADDEINRRLMRWSDAPSQQEITAVFRDLPDPGCTVLNCVLQKDGVHDLVSASDYLEAAADIGTANVSFIGMFKANEWCREQYISPEALKVQGDKRYFVWNHFTDHEYCHCLSGDYQARHRYVRFYYRCPGTVEPPYCRQLVYGADNVLMTGFGKSSTIITLGKEEIS